MGRTGPFPPPRPRPGRCPRQAATSTRTLPGHARGHPRVEAAQPAEAGRGRPVALAAPARPRPGKRRRAARASEAAGANVPGPSPITEQEREAGAREPGPSPIRVRDTRHRAGCGPAPEAVVPYRTHLSAAKAAGPRPGRGRPRSLRLFLSLRHLPLLTLATRRGARSARRRRARPLVVTLLGATSMHQASSFSGDWS